jgi:AcrR family transcriptional regulator
VPHGHLPHGHLPHGHLPHGQPPADAPRTGLRERKRAKARREIQSAALRLFGEQGYEETTVQQIAEAAVISESTVYRHFPTKADIVMRDDLDPLFIAVFRAQPPELRAVDAIRETLGSVLSTLSEEDKVRQRELLALMLSVPDLRAAMLDQVASGVVLLADELAGRTGRPATDPAVQALAGTVVGVGISALYTLAQHNEADLAILLDEALGALPEALGL